MEKVLEILKREIDSRNEAITTSDTLEQLNFVYNMLKPFENAETKHIVCVDKRELLKAVRGITKYDLDNTEEVDFDEIENAYDGGFDQVIEEVENIIDNL